MKNPHPLTPRRQVRWMVLASLLFSTACLDERCGLTNPTSEGSHSEERQNLTVNIKLSTNVAAAQVRVLVGGVEARLSPVLGTFEATIVVPNLKVEAQNVSVSLFQIVFVGETPAGGGSCEWDGKTHLFTDPEIFIFPANTGSGLSFECNEWD